MTSTQAGSSEHDSNIMLPVPSANSPEHELKRETAYPQYLPPTGIGSKMRGESSGQGVLQDGVERTRENTPTNGMSVVSTPAVESTPALHVPALLAGGGASSSSSTAAAAADGAGPTTTTTGQNTGTGRDDSRATSVVNIQYSDDKHVSHPITPVNPQDSAAAAGIQQQQHPSYFPPFTSSSSSSNNTSPSKSTPPTFPNTLLNSRDKSSLLGHPTPPHHGLPSPVQEEGEEEIYTPFPAPGSRTSGTNHDGTSSKAKNGANIAASAKFDINAFNAIGSDLSNLQLDGLTIVSGDTEAVPAPEPAPSPSTESKQNKVDPSVKLAQHAKQLDVISNNGTTAPPTSSSSTASSPKVDNRSRSSSASNNNNHNHAPTTPSSLSSSAHTSPTKPSSSSNTSQNHLQPPAATSHPVRPAPEQKKSMFGKLFQHKDKDKDKQQAAANANNGGNHREDTHGCQSSNATSPSSSHGGGDIKSASSASARNTSASRERERGGGGSTTTSRSTTRERGYSSSGAVSGTESDHQQQHQALPPMVRRPSANAVKDRESSSGGGGMGSFFGRRMSNKKMPQPDPSLLNMKNGHQQTSSRASPAASSTSVAATNTTSTETTTTTTGTSPSASTVTLASTSAPAHAAQQHGRDGNSQGLQPPSSYHGASALPSSTAASRGSTPDLTNVSTVRTAAPSPTRQPTMDNQAGGGGGRPMMRRPSGSSQQSGLRSNNNNGVSGSGAHTPSAGPTDEKHQVSQKSLREHLAALGSSAGMGMGIGKLGRKPSQTSRKSDDGRSEKSAYHPDEHAPPVPTIPTGEGSSSAPHIKRTPSVGGASVASSSLAKKYGYCEKVAIGKGATAVVKLAHKWDRSTEKLYAVKEFRKRRKNESEKEYVKKLTSEFCISSTLHHINIVETVDLVQNEEKHWCEVMEYCPGGDLYAAIKKGTMSAEDSNVYFKQIITGVAYLHSMGVAHRDIKPENLLLDAQGHIKITDFGVSDVFRMCWEKQTHLSKGLCGSEPYIAPEQFDHKEYDARLVDVWATAVVFYCMQAQELPWRVAKQSDPSFQSYLQYYPASSTPPPLGNLHPKECRAIIKKMLDPNPKTRIHMDAVLADPWVKSIEYDVPPETAPSLRL